MSEIYFILGPTACGKASVGREIARRVNGQILSVDSMKLYRGMNIGTASPPPEILQEIPHHGIDIVDPTEGYSVSMYLDYFKTAVSRIRSEGSIPIAVGGTSLYLKSMYDGLFEGPTRNEAIRQELNQRIETEGLEALHAELSRVDPESSKRIHPNDMKRVVRALEVYKIAGTPISVLQTQWQESQTRPDYLRIGLRRDKEDLNHRINMRVKRMVEAGLFEEVKSLMESPGLSPEASMAVGYAEVIDHFEGKMGYDEAIERIKINSRQLAKKQIKWQRRWADVRWFDVPEDEQPSQTVDRIMESIDFV